MSMKSQLSMLAMLAIISNPQGNNFQRNPMYDLPSEPKKPIIPNGCKEYWFDKYGWYSTEKSTLDDIVFECVSANKRSAIRKFNNWKSKSN